jgi:hypothetical protein
MKQHRAPHPIRVSSESTREVLSFPEVLPREIRDEIWREVFESETGHIRMKPFQRRNGKPTYLIYEDHWSYDKFVTWPLISLSALRTCRLMYFECRDIVWKYNTVQMGRMRLESGLGGQMTLHSWDLWPLDTRVTDLVQKVQLSQRGSCGDIRAPRTLEAVLRHLGTWRSLQLVGMNVLDTSTGNYFHKLGNEGFDNLLELRQEVVNRSGDPSFQEKSNVYSSYLRVLRKAGCKKGYLSHLRRRLSIYRDTTYFHTAETGRESPPVIHYLGHCGYNQENMILDLNSAFGGELWVDYKLCYRDGKQIKPATIAVGPLAPGNWRFRNLPYDMDHVPPNQRWWQCESDLAKLFLAVLVAGISTLTIPDALRLIEQVRHCPPFPGIGGVKPPSEERLKMALAFVNDLLRKESLESSIRPHLRADSKFLEQRYWRTLAGVQQLPPSAEIDFDSSYIPETSGGCLTGYTKYPSVQGEPR